MEFLLKTQGDFVYIYHIYFRKSIKDLFKTHCRSLKMIDMKFVERVQRDLL